MTEQERCAAHRAAQSDTARWGDDGLTAALEERDRQWIEDLVRQHQTVRSIAGLIRAMDLGPVTMAALECYAIRVWAEHGEESVSVAEPPAPPKVAGWIKPWGPAERG